MEPHSVVRNLDRAAQVAPKPLGPVSGDGPILVRPQLRENARLPSLARSIHVFEETQRDQVGVDRHTARAPCVLELQTVLLVGDDTDAPRLLFLAVMVQVGHFEYVDGRSCPTSFRRAPVYIARRGNQ